MCICMHIHVGVCKHVCMYVCMYVYMHVSACGKVGERKGSTNTDQKDNKRVWFAEEGNLTLAKLGRHYDHDC